MGRIGRQNLLAAALVSLAAITVLFAPGCKKNKHHYYSPISIDYAQKKVTFNAVIDRSVSDTGSWHLMVYEHGTNADITFFRTAVTPEQLYNALISIGAVPGNNVTSDNYTLPNAATEGTSLEMTFRWDGASSEYTLSEILTENDSLPGGGPFGVEIRFGGNYLGVPGTNPSDNTGCLTCLYTCPAGITSNCRANSSLYATDGEWRYTGNPAVLPADGTVVRITYTLVP